MKKKLKKRLKKILFENPMDERLKEYPVELIDLIYSLKPNQQRKLYEINTKAIAEIEGGD